MALRFADISSHNAVSNWGAFLGSLDGLIVKVSEGIGYTWSGAPNALAQARSAGKLVGAYHFARVNDPVAEANYFLANYAHQPGEVIVLDWEPGTTVGDGDAWAYAWCSRVIAATGVVPWLYLNHYYAAQQSQWNRTRSLGCGLWAAWYGANNGQPLPGMPSFAPWPSPTAWQYTSAGSAPGHSGALDLNYFYGTPDQWRAFGNGTAQEADLTPTSTKPCSRSATPSALRAVSTRCPPTACRAAWPRG
jgi:lysozyme